MELNKNENSLHSDSAADCATRYRVASSVLVININITQVNISADHMELVRAPSCR